MPVPRLDSISKLAGPTKPNEKVWVQYKGKKLRMSVITMEVKIYKVLILTSIEDIHVFTT